jgi:hypothetical protein
LALFLANALHGAIRNSAVCDELGAHIPAGYLYWTSGRFSGGIDNFPLAQLIIALPVKLSGCSYELFTEQHLFLFRLPVLLMGVALALVVYCFASELYNEHTGLAALFLFALSPNMVAHASLATLDLATAFFIFLATYLLYRYVERPNIGRVLAFSLALSAAIVTKVQALGVIPIALLVLVVFLRTMMPASSREKLLFFASWLIIPVTAYAVINLVYLHLPTSTGDWLPAQFVEALKGKLLHSERGHFAYLFGEYSDKGWWYYFPAAILVKTPIPVLVFVAIGLFRRHSLKVMVFVLVPILLFLGMAMKSRVNIGLRHVLTIYPFLFVIAGYGVTRLWSRTWQKVILVILGVGYCTQAVFITPHHLSYFNILCGGPAKGHKYLIDSNFDWGQNDHFLRRYIEKRGIEYKINPHPSRPTTGHILVNANALYGVLGDRAKAYNWLKGFQLTGQIAYTWFEYEVPEGAFKERRGPDVVQQRFLAYLFGMRDLYCDIEDAEFRLLLAESFAYFWAYDIAFDELRSLLRRHPAHEPALLAGGEFAVRHKLGVLTFEGDEYLTGFHTERPPAEAAVDEERIVRLSRSIGKWREYSQLHCAAAAAMLKKGDRSGATDAYRRAIRFDPRNQTAKSALASLGEGGK